MNNLKSSSKMNGARRLWNAGSRLSFLLIAVSACCGVTTAQNQRPAPAPTSALARGNMSLVAASASDIKTVLLQDKGLMVELKRWVAKDATDHGQMISESDVSEPAIFDRLDSDVQFRGVATLLLQRYGYLVPTVNPNSEAGKEQELLVKERVKWITQEEEEQRQQQRAQVEDKLQKARLCAQGKQSDCPQQQQPSQPGGAQGQPQQTAPGNMQPSYGTPNPNQINPPAFPRQGTNPLERAQLMETGEGNGLNFSQLPFGGQYGSEQSLEGLGAMGGGSSGMSPSLLEQLQNGGSGGAGAFMGGGNSNLQSAMMGMSMGGMDLGGSFDRTDMNPFEMNGVNGSMMGSSMYPNISPFAARSRFKLPYQNQALLRPTNMVRKQSPYNDIPSLYDMYMQATPQPATPQRFGMDVFENESQDPYLIPMDLPAGPDYVVGPGDGLAIDLWGGVSRRIYRTVDREGRVSLPEVGPLLVSGKSLADVQRDMQQTLRTQFRDVSADVSLARLRTVRVYVVGEVANPGAYDISSLSTPLNALFVAGGPTPEGSLRIVKHYRGAQLVETVDLYDLLLHGVRGDMQRMENGDTIQVPPIGPQVTVEGMVRRPAIYELKGETDLGSVLELAGGMLPTAALQHIEVQRTVAHEKKTMLSLKVPAGDDAAEVATKLASFEVHDGDRIRLFPIAAYNQDAIYLEGHVIRPGRYSYRADMRVTDVIASYKDLLPEPASQYAEIIRLNQPDFRPTVESFDLAAALADPAKSPVLHPMDTIRIYGRYDFENPPSVSVLGDVRNPGTYRTSGQIRLSDAIHLAGGLAPDAQTGDVQLFRYLPDGEMKISSVSLTEALGGNPAANVLLAPRDRLLVHKSPDAVEPTSVIVEGDVAKPGRYPLTTNMTVAQLILVGGGLKASADSQTADLTRYSWLTQTQLTGQHQAVAISAALAGDPKSDLPLHNGDVLTIRQLPGWNDLGAAISVKGELKHPGRYGIRPGERLSSVLERAGGFQPGAYPFGAVLQRSSVRELELKSQDQMITRLKGQQSNLELMPVTTPQQIQAKDVALQQWKASLEELSATPPAGRVAIRISPDINRWKNTAADIEVRGGDAITIPKRPSIVMVTGQVFNPTAVSYRPGRSAKWYLGQSGGPTQLADKKAVFVIRADGSVIGSRQSFWSGSSLGSVLQPGDTVVVPERAIGGGVQWQNIFLAAQVAASIASAVFIGVRP